MVARAATGVAAELASLRAVIIHPLVILQISDHWTRTHAQDLHAKPPPPSTRHSILPSPPSPSIFTLARSIPLSFSPLYFSRICTLVCSLRGTAGQGEGLPSRNLQFFQVNSHPGGRQSRIGHVVLHQEGRPLSAGAH